MKRPYLEILEDALRGLEYLRRAQVGAGPMDYRRENRRKAQELTLPFLRSSTPKKYKKEADIILKELCNLS